MNWKLIVVLALGFWSQNAIFGQGVPFNVELQPMTIQGLGGIQSFAFGQSNGKWLILGGRLDGLHKRQPFAAFDLAGHNNQLIVVDPVAQKSWSTPLSSLPTDMQEQLSSTNMNFKQDGDHLYIVGGYGYSATIGDHTTFASLIAVNVPSVIEAIINGESLTPFFRKIDHADFAVAGGRLEKIYDTYYLVGGQKFIGRYNPHGPTHGPGFVQEYTNQIRRFTIQDNGSNLSITHLTAATNEDDLHRRDYNVTPQIMPNGEEGLTAFSGVFQINVDLPFLDCVNIDSAGYELNQRFQQYYNHYHCANVPLYSADKNEMHTVFFGGIAQYFDSSGIMVQDFDVPFVKTIARITRDSSGKMTEYKLPIEMPTFLGAGSEFIPNENLTRYDNGVIDLDALQDSSQFIGYIFGGIASSEKNIFFSNIDGLSDASEQIFRVLVSKDQTSSSHQVNDYSTGNLNLNVHPNPNNGQFNVQFNLIRRSDVVMTVLTENGSEVLRKTFPNVAMGVNTVEVDLTKSKRGGVMILSLESNGDKAVRKIYVENP
jgi:hypothetical protein